MSPLLALLATTIRHLGPCPTDPYWLDRQADVLAGISVESDRLARYIERTASLF